MKSFKQFYEEMMVANTAGVSGGFGAKSSAEGPVAGKETPMGKMNRRKKPQIIGKGKYPGARKRWSENG
jgi:hypothetical protein